MTHHSLRKLFAGLAVAVALVSIPAVHPHHAASAASPLTDVAQFRKDDERIPGPAHRTTVVPSPPTTAPAPTTTTTQPPAPSSVLPDRFQNLNDFRDSIRHWATVYGLPVNLVCADIEVESDGDPSAVSYAGYKGLMQIGPGSATDFAVQISADGRWRDPDTNIHAGSEELAYYIHLAGGYRSGLAYYNAGPGGAASGLGYGYADKVLSLAGM